MTSAGRDGDMRDVASSVFAVSTTIDQCEDTNLSVGRVSTALDDCALEENDDDESVDETDYVISVDVLFTPCCSKCTICCSLPFRRSPGFESEGIVWDDSSPWDWDGGLDGFVLQRNGRDQNTKLPADISRTTVEATSKHLTQLKEQLLKAGLQKHFNQNYCGDSISSTRLVAPLDFSELELGKVLGIGGFSSVSEISSIRLHSRGSRKFHTIEDQSRQHLSNNVLFNIEKTRRSMEKKKLSSSSTKNEKARQQQHGQLCTQYAVKHLRNKLVTRTPEKFKRAAIDLVLEGQLLLVLDHPHIVGLRGWSSDGPKGYASGDPRGFFLILDKLPVSLEDRMWEWRSKLLKYQRQLKRQNTVQQRTLLLSSWARRKLLGQKGDDVSAPPNKASMKIQNLLLERLRILYGLAQAVQFMHSKRLIHRDLKIANIGFDVHGEVKLFDFGLSRLLPTNKAAQTSPLLDAPLGGDSTVPTLVAGAAGVMTESFVMSRVGTKFYMAPEVRRKEPYSLPADVYSFGVILWEVLTLSTPRDVYQQERDRLLQAKNEKGDKSKTNTLQLPPVKDGSCSWLPVCPCWPVGLSGVVKSTMSSNPDERPTMEEILVVLQKHINALTDNTLTETQCYTKCKKSNSRVDLSRADLHWLDKVEAGGNKINSACT
jgi:serine/threonine protein kinase